MFFSLWLHQLGLEAPPNRVLNLGFLLTINLFAISRRKYFLFFYGLVLHIYIQLNTFQLSFSFPRLLEAWSLLIFFWLFAPFLLLLFFRHSLFTFILFFLTLYDSTFPAYFTARLSGISGRYNIKLVVIIPPFSFINSTRKRQRVKARTPLSLWRPYRGCIYI